MTSLPRLIDGLSFHPYDNGTEVEEFVAATPDGRQFRINAMTKRVLEQLDGETTLDQVATRLSTSELELAGEHIAPIIERYQQMGLLESVDGTPAAAPRAVRVTGFPFLLSIDLLSARWSDWLSRYGQWLFAPWAAIAGIAAIIAAHVVIYSGSRPGGAISMDDYLWVVLLAVTSILIHEVGHSSALKRYGGEPGAIGFGLFLLMPVFYADVSQLWRFPRRRRIVVDLGGVYFQQLVLVALTLGFVWSGHEALRMTCFVIDFMVLMSLNPIFRFDGYWVLVDYLSVPELQKVAVSDLWGRFRALFTSATVPSLPRGIRGVKRLVFHGYSLLAGGFILVLIWLVTRYLDSAITTLPTLIPQAAAATWAAAVAGQPVVFIGKAIAFFFIVAFPLTALVGIGMHLVRLVRKMWSWTGSRTKSLQQPEMKKDASNSYSSAS